MKAILVYESLFGNTKRVAEAIAEGLGEHATVEVYEVGRAPTKLDDCDLLIVGGPTHALSMTRAATRADAAKQGAQKQDIGLREWLAKLDPTGPKPRAVTFDTVMQIKWFPSGSAARAARSALQKKGHETAVEPEHFYVTDLRGPLVDGELLRAKAWGLQLAALAASKPVRQSVQREPGRLDHLIALLLTSVMLVVLHRHDVWRTWLEGAVTAEFAKVLWAFDLSMGVQIACSLVLFIVGRSRTLSCGAEAVKAPFTILSLIVLYRIYPFDLTQPSWGSSALDTLNRVLLLAGIVGSAILAIVACIKLAKQIVSSREIKKEGGKIHQEVAYQAK